MINESVVMWSSWYSAEIRAVVDRLHYEERLRSMDLRPGFILHPEISNSSELSILIFHRSIRTPVGAILRRWHPSLITPEPLDRPEVDGPPSFGSDGHGRIEYMEQPVRVLPMMARQGFNALSVQGGLQSMTEYLNSHGMLETFISCPEIMKKQ